ncbi:hypothetical protein V6N11_019813 [Hibiscus sabdariffa]|uniref:Uncharacterized protein n=1 Tax=Hibiscus sabdariffa TaxID=183260 RepID=A0ABR1Z5G9_9ROSI
MEQKGVFFSALSVGVGIGVGLGLASGQTVNKWAGNIIADDGITGEQIEQELMRRVKDGKLSKVTFDEFPYYLRHHVPWSGMGIFSAYVAHNYQHP